MDAGTAVEFDHPHILLQNKDGIFRSMVNQTGKAMSESLIEIAKQVIYNLMTKSKFNHILILLMSNCIFSVMKILKSKMVYTKRKICEDFTYDMYIYVCV